MLIFYLITSFLLSTDYFSQFGVFGFCWSMGRCRLWVLGIITFLAVYYGRCGSHPWWDCSPRLRYFSEYLRKFLENSQTDFLWWQWCYWSPAKRRPSKHNRIVKRYTPNLWQPSRLFGIEHDNMSIKILEGPFQTLHVWVKISCKIMINHLRSCIETDFLRTWRALESSSCRLRRP